MSWRFWRLPVLLLAALLVASPVMAQDAGDFTLTILHTNDTHAHIEQYDGSTATCSEDEAAAGTCIGGVARRKTLIDQLRAAAPGGNSVLLDAGDQFQGTLFYTEYKGDEAVHFMPELGYQAMAIGNHEFDDGPADLGRFLDQVKFPVVSANIDAGNEPALDGKFAPYTIIDVNGEPVAVIGLTTVEAPTNSSPGPTVKFTGYISAVQPLLAELDGQGIDKIILLSHIGYDADKDLAAAVDGIDVIVGGHSHTLLSNTDPAASGPYPTVVNSPNGDPVLIVQAEAYGKYLGQLGVTFDSKGIPVKWDGAPMLLDSTIAEDPAILAEVAQMAIPVDALDKQVIGSTTTLIDGDRATCRFAECTMGDLVTDAMLWATQNITAQVAILNGGNIRASIEAGDISTGDVIDVLPFTNNVATMGLTGADLLAALENGVSRAEDPNNEGTGRFPQVAGIRYTWDAGKPAGARIVSAELRNTDGSFVPLDPAAVYQVAANTFMRGGGDGYTVMAEKAIDPYDFGPTLNEALGQYVSAKSPLTVELEGRVTRVDTPAAATSAATTEPAATAPDATPEPTAAAPTAAATPEAMPVTGTATNSWPIAAAATVVATLIAIAFAEQRTRRRLS